VAEHSGLRPQNDAVRIGVYQHYTHTDKDPKYYQVLTLARLYGTEETLVVYVPLYPAGGLRVTARPLKNFVAKVEVQEGKLVPRFTFVGTEIPEYSV
jgi:hypothetical protein